MYIDPLNALGPSSFGDADVQSYLNSSAVRRALGVEHSLPYFMEIGNNGYDQYTIEYVVVCHVKLNSKRKTLYTLHRYSACNDNVDSNETLPSMIDVWRDVIGLASKRNDRNTEIMILNGDLDGIVGLKGTERAVREIGHGVVSEQRRLWFYNASGTPDHVLMKKSIGWGPTLRSRDAGSQIGGFVLRVGIPSDNVRLRFVTIREAGHMTPAYAPMKTLHTLHAMFEERELAPQFPENFFDVSDDEFYNSGVFADWVVDARGYL